MLEKVRQKQLEPPKSAIEWAKTSFGTMMGVTLEELDWIRIANSLTPSYTMNLFLCNHAKDDYNFSKNNGDWIDVQQLFYLAAPDVHIVTNDKKLRARIAKGTGWNRVILFEDYINAMSR